ncbi:outer membrane beta-barrel protein [Helicobacter bizzozeronii]|uniref:outer membrane beta-barrel protein n=2 Tax=Helicobacter bizzozeronii TaxID=56877 RepID=UPI001F1A0293|nr:outer membrane beta-barrel protein [Helicobacter bizzozeronii]
MFAVFRVGVLAGVVFGGMLLAEKNGFYMGGGFVYSPFVRHYNFKIGGKETPGFSFPEVQERHSGSLFGGSLQVGYQYFLKKPSILGFRGYVRASAQGGNYAYLTYGRDVDNVDNILAKQNATQPMASFFYGAGLDILIDFYHKNTHSFGIFVGGFVGGSTWLLGKSYASDKTCQTQIPSRPRACVSANEVWEYMAGLINLKGNSAEFKITGVQAGIQIGLRANITKHQSFEMGGRVFFIPLTYYKENDHNKWGNYDKGGYGVITLQRTMSLFVNYFYHF